MKNIPFIKYFIIVVLFFAPLISKAIYVENFIYLATGNQYIGAFQVIINDLSIYLVLFLSIYISFIKLLPLTISIFIRIIAILLFFTYISDHLIILNFNTRLTIPYVFKYISYAPKYILQTFISFDLRTIVLFISCSYLTISFIIYKWKLKYKLINHVIIISVIIICINLLSYIPKDKYVYSYLYKNFIEYNRTILSEKKLDLDDIIDNIPNNAILSINTYDGSNQVVHPDIIFSEENIYLAITPYPNYNDKFENPCLYTSKDGLTFYEYGINPLIPAPPYDHNCDPDIFFDEHNKICIYYVETMRPDSNNVILLEQDGTLSFSKKTILNYKSATRVPFIVSPSIIKSRTSYFMFFVSSVRNSKFILLNDGKDDDYYRIEYIVTDTLHSWNKNDAKRIDINLPNNYTPWHLDILKNNSSYYLLINGFYGVFKDSDFSVLLARSDDLIHWSVCEEVLNNNNILDKKIKHVYRSTGLINGDKMVIWYSYVTVDRIWKLGVKKITLGPCS